MLQPLTSEHGLGCLINNAGITNLTGFDGVKPRMMADCFNVNVIAPLMVTKAVAKAWLPDGYSQLFRIVCVWPSGLLDYGSATLRCKI